MSKEQNIKAQTRMGEAVNTGNLETLKEVIAPNVVDHDPAPDQGKGPEGFIRFFTGFRQAFPDLEVKVEHLVVDEDNVAFAYTIEGTHKGDLMGIPPTGRRIKARGMQIGRFENGKLVERWGSSDQLRILQQLGLAPVSGA
jgi:steroid delta-isomerase-like uncharacterized protein